MINNNPSRAELDDRMGMVIAMLAALRSGDEEAFGALAMSGDPYELLATLAGVTDSLGVALYRGEDRWRRALAQWLPGGKLLPADDVDGVE